MHYTSKFSTFSTNSTGLGTSPEPRSQGANSSFLHFYVRYTAFRCAYSAPGRQRYHIQTVSFAPCLASPFLISNFFKRSDFSKSLSSYFYIPFNLVRFPPATQYMCFERTLSLFLKWSYYFI